MSSLKRQATTELNHENWDQDDPLEQEEMDTVKTASKEVLEKRVIRTAKRRVQQASGDDVKKSVFSGFGGFNKTQPSSFDFLANLTNGSKTTNGTSTSKPETSSSLFSSKPTTSSPGSGLFSTPVTSSTSNVTFGVPNTQSSLFSGTTTSSIQSPFGTSKSDTKTSESPFKTQTLKESNNDVNKSSNANTQSIFGSSLNANNAANPIPQTSPFKINPATASNANKAEDKNEDKKLKYYAKLKGLNESVSDWIKKHVEETPLCILTPIFKDYEKYLKEIQEEYEGPLSEDKKPDASAVAEKSNVTSSPTKSTTEAITNKTQSSLFSTTKPSIFGNQASCSSTQKLSGFSFGVNNSSNTAPTTTSGGFSFGINSTPISTTATSSSPFTLSTNSTTGSNGPSAPFSFGTGKPFSFSNIQKPPEPSTEEKDEEDEPPKVEFTPVVEENSVFDKRCKIFVKKDGNFVDKGVGTLYIKKIDETGKNQLLVRANTSLGNVLLNLILVSSLPTQRLGKNNVMLVCIPTPDAKPPPTPVLIRVKTSEEADELLEILNKYKA